MPTLIDLKDQKFGRLTILRRGENNNTNKPRWYCRCECGSETLVSAASLRSGLSTSCGCRRRETSAKLVPDLTGLKFGKLTVVERAGSQDWRAVWRCSCECGGEKLVDANSLRSGKVAACGCTHGNPTHGHTRGGKSPTFSSWSSMIARCYYPSNPAHAYYKKKGIEVCERWQRFENFLDDMGERPSLKHSIDRYPNNDGNYEPGNCRWATKREQANNRVTNVMFTYKGREMTFADLVRETGLDKEFLRHRLLRAGWSIEKAISTPPSQGQRDLG